MPSWLAMHSGYELNHQGWMDARAPGGQEHEILAPGIIPHQNFQFDWAPNWGTRDNPNHHISGSYGMVVLIWAYEFSWGQSNALFCRPYSILSARYYSNMFFIFWWLIRLIYLCNAAYRLMHCQLLKMTGRIVRLMAMASRLACQGNESQSE